MTDLVLDAMAAHIDHLVVVAHDLAQGIAWCEATLGITPGPGGEHALFGTHNRLFKIATSTHPTVYFEIIAINSEAARAYSTVAKRWFDMDNLALQAAVAQQPKLVHFVASVSNASAACEALKSLGIDRGQVLQASRPTPSGLLQWQITVRDDGQRLFHGALPTLIQWGQQGADPALAVHPTHTMDDSGLTLQRLSVSHPDAAALRLAYQAIGLDAVSVTQGTANVCAELHTPRGVVRLNSSGL